jgi:ATP-dependent Zn protease
LEKKIITYGGIEKEIRLNLGGLRDPKNRKLRYASSVHESGHAIVMAALTGKIPTAIIGVDSERGGMTIVRDNETSEEIISKLDLENSVKIGLAGYYAELVVFKDEKRILLGSGQDIEEVWDEFSKAIYSLGFFGPTSWANYESSTTSKIPGGFSDEEIGVRAKDLFDSWCEEVEEILEENKPLIIKMTKELVKTGSMTGERFLELINEGDNTIDLEAAKKRNSYEFYEEIIESYEG